MPQAKELSPTDRPPDSKNGRVTSLLGLSRFFKPYRGRLALAAIFLVLSALSTLAFPYALRTLIDRGFVAPGDGDPGARVMALREHFLGLFVVAVCFAVFAGARLYAVTWIGERVTADLRNAVYRHVIAPESSVL